MSALLFPLWWEVPASEAMLQQHQCRGKPSIPGTITAVAGSTSRSVDAAVQVVCCWPLGCSSDLPPGVPHACHAMLSARSIWVCKHSCCCTVQKLPRKFVTCHVECCKQHIPGGVGGARSVHVSAGGEPAVACMRHACGTPGGTPAGAPEAAMYSACECESSAPAGGELVVGPPRHPPTPRPTLTCTLPQIGQTHAAVA